MFTGIVEDIGKIISIRKKSKEATFTIGLDKINASEIVMGESIAVNGTCLTVVAIGKKDFSVDASAETLSKTNLGGLKTESRLNLERSLRVGDRMGGHMVSGHIDGLGVVDSITKKGDSLEFWFSLPDFLSKYVVQKGSIAVDGVSLTVNLVKGNCFSVNIIPHTQKETIFSTLKSGDKVNIECDIIGKYVEKFVSGFNNERSSLDILKKL